jgi:hypothetical protein
MQKRLAHRRRRLLMGVLPERKTQVIFLTASSVEQNGKMSVDSPGLWNYFL